MEELEELATLQNHVKKLRLQDKLGKQNFHEDLKKLFEQFTDTVEQTAQKTIGVDKHTSKAIELKEEKNVKQITKKKTQ